MSSLWLSFSIMTTMMCGTAGAGAGTEALFGAEPALTRGVLRRAGASWCVADGADVSGGTGAEELTTGGATVVSGIGVGTEVTGVCDVTPVTARRGRVKGPAGANAKSEISAVVTAKMQAETRPNRRLERWRRCFAPPRD